LHGIADDNQMWEEQTDVTDYQISNVRHKKSRNKQLQTTSLI